MTKPAKIYPVNKAERSLSVDDYVYCSHAKAEGLVSKVYEFNVIVKVTATYGARYTVGCEYA